MCENKKCNGCEFLKKNVVHNGQMTNFYNFICNYNKLYPRYINYSVPEDKIIEAPHFCPLSCSETKFIGDSEPINTTPTTRNNPNYTYTPQKQQRNEKIITEREKWEKLTPQTEWDDIKPHEVYHIPPHLGFNKRKDIEIIYVCKQYFTCRNANDTTCYNIDYIYPTSLLYKVMVKLKK